ncbi:hypothetical protein V8C43DRAFT_316330 [Trichoderma afarasin]
MFMIRPYKMGPTKRSISLTNGSFFPFCLFPLPFTDKILGTCFEPDILVAHHDSGTLFCVLFTTTLHLVLSAATTTATATHRRHAHPSCWILDIDTGPKCHLGQQQSDHEFNDEGRPRTTKDVQSAVAPQYGRLDRQSVQRPETRAESRGTSWKTVCGAGCRSFSSTGACRTARFGSRGCTPPTFMRTPSCKSQDTAQTWIFCVWRARISQRQRGSDGGGAVAILLSGSYTGTRQSWSTEKYLEPWKSRSQSDQYPVLCFAVGGRCSLGAGALARY